jgi:hypothetical protein
MRYARFNVNRKKMMSEERIDNYSLQKYLNLFKDKMSL